MDRIKMIENCLCSSNIKYNVEKTMGCIKVSLGNQDKSSDKVRISTMDFSGGEIYNPFSQVRFMTEYESRDISNIAKILSDNYDVQDFIKIFALHDMYKNFLSDVRFVSQNAEKPYPVSYTDISRLISRYIICEDLKYDTEKFLKEMFELTSSERKTFVKFVLPVLYEKFENVKDVENYILNKERISYFVDNKIDYDNLKTIVKSLSAWDIPDVRDCVSSPSHLKLWEFSGENPKKTLEFYININHDNFFDVELKILKLLLMQLDTVYRYSR
jgi:hypothetical protein